MTKQLNSSDKNFSTKMTEHQQVILKEILNELLSWNETNNFAHPVTIDLINDKCKEMVDHGVIALADQGKMFHGLKTVYDLVRKNKYSPEEYREMFEQTLTVRG